VKNKAIIFFMLFCFTMLGGCSGLTQGRPVRPKYQDPIVNVLIKKYSAKDAIFANQSGITVRQRNQVFDDLIFLTDVNYHSFEEELYQGRAFFDTTSDLAILGLGSAGGLITHSATQAIISAISGGIGGARVSISKNYFHEFSTQALIAKMQSSRRTKLEFMRMAMTLEITDYSLSRGLSDIADYYNAGTIVGALQSIVADAGVDKKAADDKIKEQIQNKYGAFLGTIAPASELAEVKELFDKFNALNITDKESRAKKIVDEFKKLQPSIPINPGVVGSSGVDNVKYLYSVARQEKYPDVRKALVSAFKTANQ